MNQIADIDTPEGCAETLRLVRRTFTVDDMPADKDHDETVKTVIARIQMDHIREFMGCFCARCRKQTRVLMSYKCRWCGVWYCHTCAASHFGPDDSANKRLIDRGYVQRLKYETRIAIRITERGLRALAIRTKKP